jgi:hypothetical protein
MERCLTSTGTATICRTPILGSGVPALATLTARVSQSMLRGIKRPSLLRMMFAVEHESYSMSGCTRRLDSLSTLCRGKFSLTTKVGMRENPAHLLSGYISGQSGYCSNTTWYADPCIMQVSAGGRDLRAGTAVWARWARWARWERWEEWARWAEWARSPHAAPFCP